MAGIAQNWQTHLIFNVVPFLRIKGDGKKIERYIPSIKNICKLKSLSL